MPRAGIANFNIPRFEAFFSSSAVPLSISLEFSIIIDVSSLSLSVAKREGIPVEEYPRLLGILRKTVVFDGMRNPEIVFRPNQRIGDKNVMVFI